MAFLGAQTVQEHTIAMNRRVNKEVMEEHFDIIRSLAEPGDLRLTQRTTQKL